MNIPALLHFNLGIYHTDFLGSIEREFASLLLAGSRIEKSELVITNKQETVRNGKLIALGDVDDIYFGLHNHSSRVNLEIFHLGLEGIDVVFEDKEKNGNHARILVSVPDLLTDKYIVDACLLWMVKKQYTPWLCEKIKEKAAQH